MEALQLSTDRPRRRRLTKKTVYFNGDHELVGIKNILVAEIEASHTPKFFNRDLNGPRQLAGKRKRTDPSAPLTFEDIAWWPVERTITVVATPDPHVCDWRCEGAKPAGECRCECQGRNHGRKFQCEPF